MGGLGICFCPSGCFSPRAGVQMGPQVLHGANHDKVSLWWKGGCFCHKSLLRFSLGSISYLGPTMAEEAHLRLITKGSRFLCASGARSQAANGVLHCPWGWWHCRSLPRERLLTEETLCWL